MHAANCSHMVCVGVESVFGWKERLKKGEHAGHRLHLLGSASLLL